MKLFFAMVNEMPVRDERRRPLIQGSKLPNGVPILLINPENLDTLVELINEYAVQQQARVELINIDLDALRASTFVSPSAIPGLPEHFSLN